MKTPANLASTAVALVLAATFGCGESSERAPEPEPRATAIRTTGPDGKTVNSETGPPSLGVRRCSRVLIGSGRSDWRRDYATVGRVGVLRRALALSFEGRSETFATKMPVLVAGHREITLKVPKRLRDRLRLFYTPENPVVTRGSGDTEVRFEPCSDKPRTIYPGGVRVIGDGPVSLLVIDEGSPTRVLPLGSPGSAYRAD